MTQRSQVGFGLVCGLSSPRGLAAARECLSLALGPPGVPVEVNRHGTSVFAVQMTAQRQTDTRRRQAMNCRRGEYLTRKCVSQARKVTASIAVTRREQRGSPTQEVRRDHGMETVNV
jgi:hypothetical protein